MPKPEFEEIDENEPRRFTLIDAPQKWEHTLTEEQLSKVDRETRNRWKMQNITGQQIEWLIDAVVNMNNGLYGLETEVIRSKQFRKYLWMRITLVIFVGWLILQALLWILKQHG